MIKKLIVKNFMGISHKEIELSNSTVISGENGLGKSTLLNAVSFMLTNTLLTDKWGVGENDLDSIVPTTITKGENTEVTIEFESGLSFTKRYVTEYSREGKVKGHHSEGLINNVPAKNMTDFSQQLEDAFGFKKVFKCVDDRRVFIDPLYLMQKVDSKTLRTFLVELGAGATNQEIFEMGFGNLKAYEEKYRGNFFEMRRDLKIKIKEVKEEELRYLHLVEALSDVKEFEPSKLNELEAEKQKLIADKTMLTNTDTKAKIDELKLKREGVEKEKELSIQMAYKELEQRIENLKMQVQIENSALVLKKNEGTGELRNFRSQYEAELKANQLNVESYNRTIKAQTNVMISIKEQGEAVSKYKAEAAINLNDVIASEYEGFVTCVNCGCTFPLDEDAQLHFEQEKASKIANLKADIENYDNKRRKLLEDFTNAKQERQLAQQEADKLSAAILELQKKINSVNEEITKASDVKLDTSKIDELKKQIEDLEHDKLNIGSMFGSYDIEIKVLNNEINKISNEEKTYLLEKVTDIDMQLQDINSNLEVEYALKSKWADKQEYQALYDKQLEVFNNLEYLLQMVNSFIQKYISLVNNRAKEITGIEFVMLEENLSNDNVKEVCYALIDGVPFANVNTAKKFEVGCKLIEKIKDIVTDKGYPRNTYPILADRLEGIDHIEKLKTMTKEQLICTRVSTDPEIVIL